MTYPGNIPLEFNLYKLASTPDLLQGLVYIFPLFYQGKLYVRHLVTGAFSGILPHILDMLKHQFRVTDVNVLPWELYTRKDISLMSSKIGPTPQPANTFRRKFGSIDPKKCNKNSILTLLKYNNANSILFVHKAKADPNNPLHRYVSNNQFPNHLHGEAPAPIWELVPSHLFCSRNQFIQF